MAANLELSLEDELRLNVMLAQKPQALRIDESRMVVYALTDKGEARVDLSPNSNEAAYLSRVKAMLSSQVTGSPGGYPLVGCRRWLWNSQTAGPPGPGCGSFAANIYQDRKQIGFTDTGFARRCVGAGRRKKE
ncbi:MAG: hypothetical protein GY802_09050 [Gammaproteobacteria bacterium]|nr:hypothetical protein [Gammaproteobacteria bacterium]